MQKIEANWEDTDNNRQVAFAVEYTRQDNATRIQSLTPTQVTFLCPQTNKPLRSIGVWTDKGRTLLADQLHQSGQLGKLEQEIDATLAV